MVLSRSGEAGSRGASRIGCLLSLIVLGLLGYFAVGFVGSEIDYRALTSQVQRSARVAHETPDPGLVAQIRAKAEELGLPRVAGAAQIQRPADNRIQISVQYPDTLTFFSRWHWVRTRRIRIDQTY